MELVLLQMFVNVKVALEGGTALNVRIAFLNLMVFLFVLIFSFSIFIWHSELYCLCGEILCRLLDGDWHLNPCWTFENVSFCYSLSIWSLGSILLKPMSLLQWSHVWSCVWWLHLSSRLEGQKVWCQVPGPAIWSKLQGNLQVSEWWGKPQLS